MLTMEIHPQVTDNIKRQTVKEVLVPLLPLLGVDRLAVTPSNMNVTIGGTIYMVAAYGSSPGQLAKQVRQLVETGTCEDLLNTREVRRK